MGGGGQGSGIPPYRVFDTGVKKKGLERLLLNHANMHFQQLQDWSCDLMSVMQLEQLRNRSCGAKSMMPFVFRSNRTS